MGHQFRPNETAKCMDSQDRFPMAGTLGISDTVADDTILIQTESNGKRLSRGTQIERVGQLEP